MTLDDILAGALTEANFPALTTTGNDFLRMSTELEIFNTALPVDKIPGYILVRIRNNSILTGHSAGFAPHP